MARIRRHLNRVEIWLDQSERQAVLAVLAELKEDPADGPGRWTGLRGYDDPELEREFQRLTAPEIRALHAADVAVLREDLAADQDRVRLDEDRAMTWLRALNRLRLVAGSRLGIEEDGWELDRGIAARGEPELAMLEDLGWLQEGIVAALEA